MVLGGRMITRDDYVCTHLTRSDILILTQAFMVRQLIRFS
jgi:hypothetical protein